MEGKPTDCNCSSWSKICVVRLRGISHAIAHPRNDYALLIDRVKEVLLENNIDTGLLLGLHDTKTNLKATKALWELEMHKTADVTIALSLDSARVLFIDFIATVLVVEFATIVTLFPLYFYLHLDIYVVLFFTLFISACFFTVYKVKFNKFQRERLEAAQLILYPRY
jgi:hypothetical protein